MFSRKFLIRVVEEPGQRTGRTGRRPRKDDVHIVHTFPGKRLQFIRCRRNGLQRHRRIGDDDRAAVRRKVDIILEGVLHVGNVGRTEHVRVDRGFTAVRDLVDLFGHTVEEIDEGRRQSAAVKVERVARQTDVARFENTARLQIDGGIGIENADGNNGLPVLPIAADLRLIRERPRRHAADVDGVTGAERVVARCTRIAARTVERTAPDVERSVLKKGIVGRLERPGRLIVGKAVGHVDVIQREIRPVRKNRAAVRRR